MGMRRIDQIWLAAGLAFIVLLVAGAWFLFISAKFDETDEVNAEAEAGQIQLVKKNKEVAALVKLEEKRELYLAQLKEKQVALPTTYGMPAFLRQLQVTGNAMDVDVRSITVAPPVKAAAVPSAVELPITLSAYGSTEDISRFLIAMQNGSRAVLIKSISLVAQENKADLSLTAFCVPPATPSTARDTCKA